MSPNFRDSVVKTVARFSLDTRLVVLFCFVRPMSSSPNVKCSPSMVTYKRLFSQEVLVKAEPGT